ncbi:Serine protease [Planctomycetales bacterium 10988]|nr:Serine protease [Planctomycetales bacterium 10988]
MRIAFGSRLIPAVLTGLSLLLAYTASPLQAGDPEFSYITPDGGQRGVVNDIRLRGNRLDDFKSLVFYSPGIEVTEFEVKDARDVRMKVKIDKSVPLGEHPFRIVTESGISVLATMYVGPFHQIEEGNANDSPETALPVPLNTTVNGRIDQEDLDYFAVDLVEGDRFSVEVEGMRLGNTFFDPAIFIMDAEGTEVARSDDTRLYKRDPFLSMLAPKTGKYTILLRDASFEGNSRSGYRLHVGTFPRPRVVYPAGGKVGTSIEVKLVGDGIPNSTQQVKLPQEVTEEYSFILGSGEEIAPSQMPFRLSQAPNVLEKEPNNVTKDATPAELPAAFNGIIQTENDFDFFVFEAKKNDRYLIRCFARQVGSPLDAVLTVMDAKGKSIVSNDDKVAVDPEVDFKAPADGKYYVRVYDHLRRGGEDFVYRVEFDRFTPEVTFTIPEVRRYSQERHAIAVPQGNRFAVPMNVARRYMSGELDMIAKNLPEGVTMHTMPLDKSARSLAVVFEAKPDAPLGSSLVDLQAKLTGKDTVYDGGLRQQAILVRGRVNELYWTNIAKTLAVAVTKKVPFEITVEEPKVPIVQNGSMNLKVKVKREEGFNEAIRLEFPFRPPGLGASYSVNIPAGKSEADYPLNANSRASVGNWHVVVVGSANVGGTTWIASPLIPLEISQPFASVSLQRTAVEQGKETLITGTFKTISDFDKDAVMRLIGLPSRVTAEEIKINKDTKEVSFTVKTDEKSPAGRHKSIYAEFVIDPNGEPIKHRLNSVELRIDKPLPPKDNQQVKKEEPKKPAPAKQLSRLEQLRLEAKGN